MRRLTHKKTIFLTFLALVFLLYGNTLVNDYAIDDEIVLLENPVVKKGVSGIGEIFTSRYHSNEGEAYEYRPVLLTTFALEYTIFGINPFVSHLINLILFVFVLCLIFVVFEAILPSRYSNYLLLAIILFLFHPINTEVINNVKSRDELLYFLFSLLSFLFIIKFYTTKRKRLFVYALFFMTLAALSKISAVVFIVLIPFTLLFFRRVSYKQAGILFLLLTAAISVYLIISYILIFSEEGQFIRTFQYFENPLYYSAFVDRIPASVGIVAYYVKLLFIPSPLSFYYGYDQVPLLNWSSVLFYFLVISLVLLGYFLFKIRRKHRVLVYSTICFFVALFPYSNIVLPAPGIVAERFIFLSSFFFTLTISYLIFQITHSKLRMLIIIAVLFISTPLIWQRNVKWSDTLTLMENDIQHLTNSFKANSLYASKLFSTLKYDRSQDKIVKVEELYLRALNVYDQSYIVNNNLAVLYLNLIDEPEKAKKYLLHAIAIDSTLSDAQFNLALAYKKLHNYEAMFAQLDQFVYAFPSHLKARIIYVKELTQKGEYDLVLNVAEEGLFIFEDNPELLFQMANAYANLNDINNAFLYFEKVFEVTPSSDLAEHLAKLAMMLGNEEKHRYYTNFVD